MASVRQSGACLLLLSFILLSLGTIMLLFDGTNFLKLNRQSKEFSRAVTSARSFTQSVLSVILSVLGLAIGACGFVGFCTTSRPILTVFLAGIAIDLLCRILLCSLMLISGTRAHDITEASMQQVIGLYGASENSTGVQFTKAVNEFGDKELCCGWAGSVHSKSIFENSTWHRKLLENPLVMNEMKRDKVEQKPTSILLPTHCCAAVKRPDNNKIISAANTAGYCTQIYDLDKAREQGAIHGQSCLDIMVSKMRTLLYIYMAVHAVLLLISACSGFVATQFLKSSTIEQVKGAGDGRIMDDAGDQNGDDGGDNEKLSEMKGEIKAAETASETTAGTASGETSP